MQGRTALEVINFLKNNDPHQTFLSLKGVTFDSSEQFTLFCDALVNNTSVTTLECTGCNVDKVNKLDTLFVAIAYNKTLKQLSFAEWPTIRTHLDMLSDALSSPCGKSILELNLSNCQITDNNISNLNFLSYNQSLQKLILSNTDTQHPLKNKINVSGVISLAKQLKHAQHHDKGLLALEQSKDSQRYRNFQELAAQAAFTAKNTTILEIDLKNNPAANSKHFNWDEIISKVEDALKKNRLEAIKRNPAHPFLIKNLNAISPDAFSAPQQQEADEVVLLFDFYIMKSFSSELANPKYEDAYIFIQESSELFHITEGEAYKIKILDIEKFKSLLTETMGKQTYKLLRKNQIETLTTTNTSFTNNIKLTAETKQKPKMDIRELKLPKNLSHQPQHTLIKSTNASNIRSTNTVAEAGPSFSEILQGINESLLSTIWPLSFMSGAGGLGVGCIIATGLLLFGVISTGPIGIAIFAAIAGGCMLAGAGIGAIAGHFTPPHTPVLPTSSHATITLSTSREKIQSPSPVSINPAPEKSSMQKAPVTSVTRFGGALFLTEEDLRKPKAARERKIAANTLLNSIT